MSKNAVTDLAIAPKAQDQKAYTYAQILSYKVLKCLRKNSASYLQYKKHMEIVKERLDIVNFI